MDNRLGVETGKPLRLPNLAEIVCSARLKYPQPNVVTKRDGSPVTEVDVAVHEVLSEWFEINYPNHTFISEEQVNANEGDPSGSYIFLDPIDGTENFVSGIPLWATGISIYTAGNHQYSEILAPELGLAINSEMDSIDHPMFQSRIKGYSSSSRPTDLMSESGEFRVFGSAMVNFIFAIQGRLTAFENNVGAECWDILPGLNIALKAGMRVLLNGETYSGEPLFPGKKYKFSIDWGRR